MMQNVIEAIVRKAYEKIGEPEILTDVNEDYYKLFINTEKPYVDMEEFSSIIATIEEELHKNLLRKANSYFYRDFYVMDIEPFEYEGT